MDTSKYDRNISLLCPTCGGADFEFDTATFGEASKAKCTCCGLELTKDELMEENGELISAQVKEIGEEFTKDLAKDFKKSLQDALRSHKNIGVK